MLNTINKDFLINSFKVFTSNWIVFAFEFLIGVIIVYYYGSLGKGQFSAILSFSGLIASFSSLGLNNSRVYFENKKLLNKDECFSIQLTYQIILIILLILPFLFLSNQIINYLEINAEYSLFLIYFIIASVSSQIFILFLNSGYLGVVNTKKYAQLRLTFVILKLLSVLLCSILYFDILYAFYLLIILETISIIVILYKTNFHFISLLNINRKLIIDFIQFGFKSNLTVVINNLLKRFDLFLIIFFLSIEDYGVYSIAVIFLTLMMSVSGAVNGILFGKLTSNKFENKDIINISILIFIATTLFALILSLVSKPLILVFYGQDFLEAVPVSILLISSAVFVGSSSVFKTALISVNKANLNTYEQLITAMFQIPIMYYFISKYGLVGVGVSILSGSIISSSFRFYLYKKYFKQ